MSIAVYTVRELAVARLTGFVPLAAAAPRSTAGR